MATTYYKKGCHGNVLYKTTDSTCMYNLSQIHLIRGLLYIVNSFLSLNKINFKLYLISAGLKSQIIRSSTFEC